MSFISSLVAKFKAFINGHQEAPAEVKPQISFAELIEIASTPIPEEVAVQPVQEAEVAVRRAPRKRKPKMVEAAPAPAPQATAKKKPVAKKVPAEKKPAEKKYTHGPARPPRKAPVKKAK